MGNSNSGRKSKEADQKMVEELSKFSEDAYKVLHNNILANKSWAVKLWFDRLHGKAKESKDLNLTNSQERPLFNIHFKTTEELNKL
tara:strand:- start:175 stop:432 length:258 start_codon:yes stop_codon:yes gene_type:complete